MNEKQSQDGSKAIQIGERLIGSVGFQRLFKDGMALVETTASYLDGPGRAESRGLSATTSLVYATESMRLTTRLMQMASWLLLQRAVAEKEMTAEDAADAKHKLKLCTPASEVDKNDFDELPETFKDLISQSLRLQATIQHMDQQLKNPSQDWIDEMDAAQKNPVADQLGALQAAFDSK